MLVAGCNADQFRQVAQHLKEQHILDTALDDPRRAVVVVLDEMHCKAGLWWDGQGELVGFGDDEDVYNSQNAEAPALANKALTSGIQGLYGKGWFCTVTFVAMQKGSP